MDRVDEILADLVRDVGYKSAFEMFGRINSGKKLRSKLILKIAGESKESLKLCAVVEMIHLASLLHDDVIDDAALRRGRPSINALFGTKNSIMLGDILYSKGFYEIVKFNPKIAEVISKAVLRLSVGEMMDVELGSEFNAELSRYLEMIELKTAALIEAAAHSAALLASLDSLSYAKYGKNLGLAFQIVDDILDITATQESLGKPAFSDYKEGKTTLPYILLFGALGASDRDRLKSMFGRDIDGLERAWLEGQFREKGIIEKSLLFARELGQKAMDSVGDESLKEIVFSMINREF